MPTLETRDVDRALMRKMHAERGGAGDWYYAIEDDKGVFVASTTLSRGPKDTLSEARVSDMAHQLRLGSSRNLVNLVQCTLNHDAALKIMKSNPPGSGRQRS